MVNIFYFIYIYDKYVFLFTFMINIYIFIYIYDKYIFFCLEIGQKLVSGDKTTSF